MKKKIITTSWHKGGANAIIPIIKRLKEERKLDILALGHGYSEDIFNSKDIDYKTIQDFGLNNVSKESMQTILERENVNLVLTGTSVQDDKNKDVIEQTITLAAKERGIPTLAILDFWANYSIRFSDIYNNQKFKFLPDRIAIIDEFAEKEMLDEGFSKNILIITGNPHFDDLERKSREFTKEKKQDIEKKIKLNHNLWVFYTANKWKTEKDNLNCWGLDIIKLISESLNNEAGLIVKLHYSAYNNYSKDLEELIEYVNQHPKGRIIVPNIEQHELILASDLILTPFSTTAIEAVYMERPCISLQPGLKGIDYLSMLTHNGIIPVGYTIDDCRTLIQKAIKDKEYRKKLLKNTSSFKTDGKATERVVSLIYQMIGV